MGPKPKSPGRAGQTRGKSGTDPSQPGEVVDPSVLRNRARVTQDSWSNPWCLGHWHQSPGTASRPCRTSRKGPSPRRPGQLVDNAGHWTRARMAKVSWSTPWELGHGPESPRRDRGFCGTSDQSASLPGLLVNTADPQTRARVARGRRSIPRCLGHEDKSPRTAGRHRRPTDTGLILPGQLVDTEGPQTWTRVAQERY